jgi:DNA-binding MarR family transcriptional regulator
MSHVQSDELSAPLPEQESLGFLLTDNLRLTRRIAARYFEQYNLTLAQARALLGVYRWQGIRQVDLADYLEIQPISLARLLDQLAESGWVERRPDPQDRRAFQLHLTPAATPIVRMIKEASRAFEDSALAGFSEAQKAELFLGLHRLRDNLTALSKEYLSGETPGVDKADKPVSLEVKEK